VATVEEVVETQAQMATVDTTDAATGGSISNTTITSLPLATRNFQQLLDLSAGTCPKAMRNGPCGGTLGGRCEVVDKPCIWITVYERAKATGRINDLQTYVPPRNLALQGTSSWINYFLNRDSRPVNEVVAVERLR
jgi:hypothetical protein